MYSFWKIHESSRHTRLGGNDLIDVPASLSDGDSESHVPKVAPRGKFSNLVALIIYCFDFLKQISLPNYVLVLIRRRRINFLPCRGVRIRLRGTIAGNGWLVVGTVWQGAFPFPSQFIVRAGGICRVSGRFKIFTGCSIGIGAGALLDLGSGYIGSGANISCFKQIRIGNGVAIGDRVTIRDSDSHQITGGRDITVPISIGDKVWIGMNVSILKGVNIGDGAVVAAGSIVTKDVAPGTLVAGNPARYIRNVSWS